MQNAPHLVHNQSFIVPNYDWWDGPFYGIGLKVYDLLAGKLGLGPSKILSKEETIDKIPNIETDQLHGGVIYYDGQFDDSRLAVNLVQTINENMGCAVNYMEVVSLLKTNNFVSGMVVVDKESGKEYTINARVVVNATGIFTDNILKMDDKNAPDIITLSQGIHLVLDKKFLEGDSAIMVPQTDDGRVLFAVPWYDKVIVGTTDTEVDQALLEPIPLEKEVEFVLEHAKKYMDHDPELSDVRSIFAGIRPLLKPAETKSTASISRDHHIQISQSGLVTITGGKWTTYRKMGEDVINQAALVAGLEEKPSLTRTFRIHGWLKNLDKHDPRHVYGSDGVAIRKMEKEKPKLAQKVSNKFSYSLAEILWMLENEMTITLEDLMARRTRMLFLDADESIRIAPELVKLMATHLKKGRRWQKDQLEKFINMAQIYSTK